jgi:glutamate-1-semialdehyde 2,1-aminomutase
MVLGHAHPAVVRAIADAAAMGTSYGAPTEREVALRRGPVRGRPLAWTWCGCARQRHRGVHERAAPRAGLHGPRQGAEVRGLLPRPRGLPAREGGQRRWRPSACPTARRARGDGAQHPHRPLQRPRRGASALAEHGARSPRSSSSPWWATWAASRPPRASSRGCAALCEHGALLIFDEVMTGFRLALGGAQAALRRDGPTSPPWARSSAAACPSRPSAAAPT